MRSEWPTIQGSVLETCPGAKAPTAWPREATTQGSLRVIQFWTRSP
jgi:hypothetical protein